jgi:hypothetical protein
MEQPEGINIPVAWIGLDERPIELANQFLIQHEPNEFILTIGQLSPPPLIGSQEQQAEQVEALDFVPIRALCRVSMAPNRLRDLIAILQETWKRHDRHMEEIDPTTK